VFQEEDLAASLTTEQPAQSELPETINMSICQHAQGRPPQQNPQQPAPPRLISMCPRSQQNQAEQLQKCLLLLLLYAYFVCM